MNAQEGRGNSTAAAAGTNQRHADAVVCPSRSTLRTERLVQRRNARSACRDVEETAPTDPM